MMAYSNHLPVGVLVDLSVYCIHCYDVYVVGTSLEVEATINDVIEFLYDDDDMDGSSLCGICHDIV